MKKILLNSLGMLAALGAMSGCGGNKKSAATGADSVVVVPVRTQTAVIEDVERNGVFTSNIQPLTENNIAPSLAVRIDRILVDVGANVSRGQLLVRMDPSQFNQASVQMATLDADFARMKSVYDAGGISKQQLDQTEAQLKVQREQLANIRENIELRSPISGVVTARNYDAGDLYSPGRPILQVMQINTLKVVISISEQYFPLVRVGMPAEISVDMFADRTFPGKVSLVYPAIDPATRTFTVEISIPNNNLELRPGMFSRTTLRFGSTPGIMVEDLAIQRQMGTGDKYVFVARDGHAERRLVTTGAQTGDRVNILSGIDEGDEVIVSGVSELMNGTPIRVEKNR